MILQGLIAGVLEAGQDIPKEYFEAILRKACPLTNTMMEPDEIAQVWPQSLPQLRFSHCDLARAEMLGMYVDLILCPCPTLVQSFCDC